MNILLKEEDIVQSPAMNRHRLIKHYLHYFKVSLDGYSAEQRGIPFMPSEKFSALFNQKLGVKGELAASVRLVLETNLIHYIFTHRGEGNAKTDMTDEVLWKGVAQRSMAYLSVPAHALGVKISYTLTTIHHLAITTIPIARISWALEFEESNTVVNFVTMGYVKPVGSIHLGVTFISNEQG